MKNKTIIKGCLILSLTLTGAIAFADNDIHTGELSGDYSGESHIDSVWENTYVKDGEKVIFSGSSRLSVSTNYTRANFTRASLTSARFDGAILTDANFTGANLTSASFHSLRLYEGTFTEFTATLTGADFTDAIIKGANFWNTVSRGFTESQLKSTNSYKEKDLSGIKLSDNNMSGWDFSGQNLNSADFYRTTLTGTNFTNANLSSANFDYSIIKGANFSGTVGFTESQLKSTNSYKEKDLSGIGLSNNNMSGWDFSGQNLQNSQLCYATLSDVNFKQTDLRGSDLTGITGSLKTQNTIWADGEIKNFSMESVDDSLTIRAYVPATAGGAMINAKIVDDASISGGAVLTLGQGAVLEIVSGKTLSVLDDSEIIFNVDAVSDATKILLGENSKLAFASDSKITINLDGTISPDDSYTFSVIEMAVGSQVTGTDSLKKENVILNVNGEEYDSSKWTFDFDSSTGALNINVNVPEPAEWAMILGAIAIAFAAYRRRK